MRIKRSQERMILAGRVLLQQRQQQQQQQQQQQKVDAPEVAAHFDRVRGDLQSRGVAEDLSCKIAAQLCDQHDLDALSPSQYEAMLEGATLACGAHCEADEDSQATTGRVRDIERMMQAFAGELAKLDESLEILATYVQRMRKLPATKLSTRKNETLH